MNNQTEDTILEAQARLRIENEQLTKRVERLENAVRSLSNLESRVTTLLEAGAADMEVGKKLDLLNLDDNWNDEEPA